VYGGLRWCPPASSVLTSVCPPPTPQSRGWKRPSKIRVEKKQLAAHRKSYERVQKALAHIELEQLASAIKKRQERRREKLIKLYPELDYDPFYDGVLEGKAPPDLDE